MPPTENRNARLKRLDNAIAQAAETNGGVFPNRELPTAVYQDMASSEGIAFWRERSGLPDRREKKRRERTEAAVAALSEQVGGHFPTNIEWTNAGEWSTYLSMSRHEGLPWWRQHMGLETRDYRGQGRTLEEDAQRAQARMERLDAAIAAVADGSDRFPSVDAFRDAGRISAYNQMSKREGIAFWQQRSGLRSRRDPQVRLDRLDAVIAAVADGSDEFPSVKAFRDAGHISAYQDMARTEGMAFWRDRSGLEYVERRGRPRSTPKPSETP